MRFFSLLETSFKTCKNMQFVKLHKAYMLGRNMNEPVNKVSIFDSEQSALLFLGLQSCTCIKLEEDDVTIFHNVIAALLSVLAGGFNSCL